MNEDRSILTDEQWQRVRDLLPGKRSDRGRTAANNRLFLEAIVWLARTGCPWRDLPPHFGTWNSVYIRFARWCEKGVWEKIFEVLSVGGDFKLVMIDSTVVRAHQHASGAQKKKVLKRLGVLAVA